MPRGRYRTSFCRLRPPGRRPRYLVGARAQDLDGDGQISADEKAAAKEKRVKFGKIVRTNLKICVTQLVLALVQAGMAIAALVECYRAVEICRRRSRPDRVEERVAGASASRRHCIDLHNLLYT